MDALTFVVLSTTDWDAPQYGSRQAIARSLARRGHRVLFVEVPRSLHSLVSDPVGTRRALGRLGRVRTIEDRLLAYTPRPVLPIHYHRWTSALNQRLLGRDLRRILAALDWRVDVLWTYWPNSAPLCGRLGERLAVYHCIDDFRAVRYPLVRSGTLAWLERELCRRVDLVFASTEALAHRCGADGAVAHHHLPTGVELAAFDPSCADTDPAVAALPAPRVGFVGTLDDRIDVDAIAAAAQGMRDVSFVMVGPVKSHRASHAPLRTLPNVHFLGERPHDRVAAVLAGFDVAMLPYRRTPFTESVQPAKLFEYLAMGVPAVATDLPFARRHADAVRVLQAGESLANALRETIIHPPSDAELSRRRRIAREHAWEQRVDEIESRLTAALAQRQRLRVLEVVASSRGGGASHVRDLALGLDRKRFRVDVVLPSDGGHVRGDDFTGRGVVLWDEPLARGLSLRTLARLGKRVVAADLVHAHGARAAFWVRLAARSLGRRRPRVVYSIHGLTIPSERIGRRSLLRWIERRLASVTDAYVAVCEAERAALCAEAWVPGERVAVVRNGVRAVDASADARRSWRSRCGVEADAVVVVTVCRLDRPRDFPTLLAAFADVARRVASTSLWIVGDGPLRDDIARQVRAAGLDERVRLLGMVRDVPGVLAASDVFVLTSTGGDGLPIGILEAMVAGLPVVATRCDGIPEAVGEGQTGLLVPRADSAALSRALDELVAGAERRRALGAEGRRVALRSFAIEDCVAALAALYEQIVARGGRDE